jgi:hypothetical protein
MKIVPRVSVPVRFLLFTTPARRTCLPTSFSASSCFFELQHCLNPSVHGFRELGNISSYRQPFLWRRQWLLHKLRFVKNVFLGGFLVLGTVLSSTQYAGHIGIAIDLFRS